MVGILIVAHGAFGEALIHCASHVLGKRPPLVLGLAQGGKQGFLKHRAKAIAELLAGGAAVAPLLAPAALQAQSLLATSGLGVPTPPLDARARALGGVPTGLFGFDLSLGNPADAADVLYRGGMASLQPFSRSDELGGQKATTSGARFPLLRVLYPSNRYVFSLGYGGFLDQSWGVSATSTGQFGGDTATLNDVVRSDGGIAQLRLGASYLLSPRVAVGGAVGLYTGGVTRQVTRTFPDSSNADFQGFDARTSWGFHGPLAAVGVRADIGAILRVAR